MDSYAADARLKSHGLNCLAGRGLVSPPNGVARFSSFCNATGDRQRFPAQPVAVKSHDNNVTPVAVRSPMSKKRRSYEAGHSPKFMVVIDDSPECDRALYFASRRALRIGATVLMLRVCA